MTAKVYRAYRTLKVTLGQLDAAYELSELSLRYMSEASSDHDFAEFVSKQADRHGLNVRVGSSALAFHTVALSAITTVHGAYEAFITDLVSEARTLVGLEINMGSKPESVSKHDHLIAKLRGVGRNLSQPEFALLNNLMEHFRLVRNAHVHRSMAKAGRIEQLRKNAVEDKNWETVFPCRPYPSPYTEIGFPDFLLFANAARLVSRLVAEILLPSENSLAKHVDVVEFLNRPEKATRTRIGLFLRDRFALDEAAIARIIAKI